MVYWDNGNLPVAVYEGGMIGVSLGTDADGYDIYFVNEPVLLETGEIQWYCFGQNLEESLLPEVCR